MFPSNPHDKDSCSLEAKSHDARASLSLEAEDIEKQSQAAADDRAEYMQGLALWAAMGTVTLVYFLVLMDSSILSTAIPEITNDFHSLESIGWYGAAYVLACATLQPLTGKLYVNFDTKWSFFTFFLLFELGSLLCAVSLSSNMFIVSRAVAGLGASGLQNGALNIITACVSLPKQPAVMGVLFGVGQLGLVAGPLIGGLFTQYVSWRWCFYINLPVGAVVAMLLALLRIPEAFAKPPPSAVLQDIHHKLDLVGFVLFAPSTIMLLLAVQWGGNEYDWDSAVIIGMLCGAAATFMIWLARNGYRKDDAMIPLHMLRKRHVLVSCLFGAFLAGVLFVLPYYLSVYFQGVRGKAPAISGVYLLPSILSQLFASVVSGKLTGYFGYYLPWGVISAVLTAIGCGLLSSLTPYMAAGKWVGYQVIAGAGRGCGMAVPLVAVQNTLTPRELPIALSLLIFAQTLSGSIFLSAGATILTNSLTTKLEEEVPGIDLQAVLAAGANGIRDVVESNQLPGVLTAYAESVDHVFYLCLGLALGCFVLAPWLGWIDIRKGKTATTTAEKATTDTA